MAGHCLHLNVHTALYFLLMPYCLKDNSFFTAAGLDFGFGCALGSMLSFRLASDSVSVFVNIPNTVPGKGRAGASPLFEECFGGQSSAFGASPIVPSSGIGGKRGMVISD